MFSERELASLEALASVLLPEGLGLPGAASARTVESLDEQVGGWSPEARAGVRLLVRTWEWNPLLSSHLKRFSRLSRASQRDWIDRVNHSKLIARRLQLVALKQLLTLAWASSPEVEDALGFDYAAGATTNPTGPVAPSSATRASRTPARSPRTTCARDRR